MWIPFAKSNTNYIKIECDIEYGRLFVCVCVRMFVQPKLAHWGVKQQKFDHIFKRGVIQPFANSIYSACMCTEISTSKCG